MKHRLTRSALCAALALAALGGGYPTGVRAQAAPDGGTEAATEAPAAEPEPAPAETAQGRILTLERGKRAPWAGMLIEEKDLVRWRLEIDRLRWRGKADVELEKNRSKTKTEYLTRILAAEKERGEMREKIWHDRSMELTKSRNRILRKLEKEKEVTFFEQPVLWLIVGGVIVGGAAAAL